LFAAWLWSSACWFENATRRKVLGASYNDLTSANQLDEPSGNAALNGVRVWVEAV
jgi:hypothetical protein